MPAASSNRLLSDAHCLSGLAATSREEAVLELSQALVRSGALSEAGHKVLVASVLKREDAGTTGIGNGVALPHPKSPEDVAGHVRGTLIAVGVAPRGIDFAAVDGAPVFAVFLVAAPTPEAYLSIARRVAGIARDRRWPKLLKQCRTPHEIRELVEEAWEGQAP